MARLSPARSAALEVCRAVRERRAFAAPVLDVMLPAMHLSGEDEAFARVLVFGVVSTQGTLDDVIDQGLASPDDIASDVRDALRISAYELLFLKKEPYVAVSQGVELVRSVAPRAAKLGNFALHRVAEAAERIQEADGQDEAGQSQRSMRFGFPEWLGDDLLNALGDERAEALMKASNEQAPVFLAVNACAAVDAQVIDELEQAGTGMRPVRFGADGDMLPGALRLLDTKSVGQWPVDEMLAQGQCIVADASAQAIALLSLPDPAFVEAAENRPVCYLEVGAGRATKTILIQSHAKRILGAPMDITCVDKHAFKGRVLEKRTKRLGVPVARIIEADAADLSEHLAGEYFDACLVDAPCSGLGTLRRHPEIRWSLAPNDIETLAETGLALLTEASRYIAPGGRLTYSTCTVLPQENEHVVKAFLASEEGQEFDIVPIALQGAKRLTFHTDVVPGGPDAHFACVMQRKRG